MSHRKGGHSRSYQFVHSRAALDLFTSEDLLEELADDRARHPNLVWW